MNAFEALLVVCLIKVTTVQGGENEEATVPSTPSYSVPVYNPVNIVTINNGCNRTDDDYDMQQELNDIKHLMNTIVARLGNGDCMEPSAEPSAETSDETSTETSAEPSSYPRDCYEVQDGGETASGIYTINPNGTDPFQVYCDMDTDGGGWTVFQRRQDGTEDFFLGWDKYTNGFGSLEGEHWLGNENLYHLNNQKSYVLRVDLEDFDDAKRFAKYDTFIIANSDDNYRLHIGGYSGNAGSAMGVCNNKQFTTRDQDHDTWGNNCAVTYKGGWWYENCHYANLNGLYLEGASTYGIGINWAQWRGYTYSLKFSEMKIRPI